MKIFIFLFVVILSLSSFAMDKQTPDCLKNLQQKWQDRAEIKVLYHGGGTEGVFAISVGILPKDNQEVSLAIISELLKSVQSHYIKASIDEISSEEYNYISAKHNGSMVVLTHEGEIDGNKMNIPALQTAL